MRKVFMLLLCCALTFTVNILPVHAASIGEIGQILNSQGYQLTVNDYKNGWSNFDNKPFVAVNVTIKSSVDEGVSANPLFGKLKSENGYIYEPTFFAGVEPSLTAENDIPQGESVRGWITFQVPEEDDSQSFTFQYKPWKLFGGKGPDFKVNFERY